MRQQIDEAPRAQWCRIPDAAREGLWHAGDGHAIRRIDFAPAADVPLRGGLLFLPGRGDIYEKYLEVLSHWSRQGWHATAIDWRGQAGSGREGRDSQTGHIADFSIWIKDLADFWQDWAASVPGPHALVGHSMGGHLALRALAERRVDPFACVLTTPMLGFFAWGMPLWAQHSLARAHIASGDPRRPAWKVSEKPLSPRHKRMLLLTHDARRYAEELCWKKQRPHLVMGSASWGWMERALESMRGLQAPGVLESVRTPVQLFTTSADGLVSHAAILRAARRLPHGELVTLGREARHELLRETDSVREPVLAAIDAFLARHRPESVVQAAAASIGG
ncbi:MAG TPA: alpha/beta hydrolase [Novosphingobium sp.]|nr:alpha/beta hydrolase [Novosphingobium sp.]